MSESKHTQTANLNEGQFLAHQEELARRAIARTWEQITAGLAQGANPVEWAREYPWTAMGAAALAGFLAAASLVPSKEEQALKKLTALERALHPPTERPAPQSDKDRGTRGLLGEIILEAIRTLRPVLVSAITASMAGPDSASGPGSSDPPDPAGGTSPPDPPD